jgi:hypothetical protein
MLMHPVMHPVPSASRKAQITPQVVGLNKARRLAALAVVVCLIPTKWASMWWPMIN